MWNSANAGEFKANNFGFLRLALSSLVVVAHSFVAVNGSNAGEPLYEFTDKHLDLGALAVDSFFVASGFMVSESLLRSTDALDFLRKRILRLYPAFILLWLLQAFVIAPAVSTAAFSGYSLKQWGTLLFNLVTLSSYGYPYGGLLPVFGNNPVPGEMNISLWTLRYEFGCYLGLAALALTGWFRRRWVVTGLFITSWVLLISGIKLPWHRVLTALLADGAYWPRFATFFLAGAVFWHWKREIPRLNSGAFAASALIILSLLQPRLLNVILPVAWTYLLMWLAYARIDGLAAFGSKVDVSYGTYLYAFPIQQLIISALPGATPWQMLALSLPATLLAGFCSWHLVEKRFLGRSRKAVSPTSGD